MTTKRNELIKIFKNFIIYCGNECKIEEHSKNSRIKEVKINTNSCFVSISTKKISKYLSNNRNMEENCDGLVILCNGEIKYVLLIELKTTLFGPTIEKIKSQFQGTLRCFLKIYQDLNLNNIEKKGIAIVVFRRFRLDKFYSSQRTQNMIKSVNNFIKNNYIELRVDNKNIRIKLYKKQITEETAEISIDEILHSFEK